MAKANWARTLTGAPMLSLWGIAVLVGMFQMVRYQMTPAVSARELPRRWPAGIDFAPAPGLPTLVMTLHPQCPCSRASVYELAELMARAAGKLDAHVLFVEPPNAPPSWLDGDLWRQANAVPGVVVSVDKDGRDAGAFGASTSGQVLVYSPAGELEFSGGITDGRGHEGDNPGFLSILSLLLDGKPTVSQTPVYGCSLGMCRNVHN